MHNSDAEDWLSFPGSKDGVSLGTHQLLSIMHRPLICYPSAYLRAPVYVATLADLGILVHYKGRRACPVCVLSGQLGWRGRNQASFNISKDQGPLMLCHTTTAATQAQAIQCSMICSVRPPTSEAECQVVDSPAERPAVPCLKTAGRKGASRPALGDPSPACLGKHQVMPQVWTQTLSDRAWRDRDRLC